MGAAAGAGADAVRAGVMDPEELEVKLVEKLLTESTFHSPTHHLSTPYAPQPVSFSSEIDLDFAGDSTDTLSLLGSLEMWGVRGSGEPREDD